MEFLERERLFDIPLGLSNPYLSKLLELLEEINFGNLKNNQKEKFYLCVFDLWSLIQIGNEFETHIRSESVQGKAMRISLVNYFYNEYKNKKEYFQILSTKSFLMITLVVKKVNENLSDKLKEFIKIAEVSEKIYRNEINQVNQANDVLQNHLLKTTVQQAIEQTNAAEELFGNTIWGTLETLDVVKLKDLFFSIENNRFSEVIHWLERFQTKRTGIWSEIENATFVFCVQQDESMEKYIHFQVAIAYRVSEILKKYKNDIIIVPFAQAINKEIVVQQSKLTIENYLDFYNNININKDPINYKMTLNYAFTMLKLELSTNISGDIILICNEKLFDNLPDEEHWKNAVEQFKMEMQIEIIVIYLGELSNVEQIWFADDVVVLFD